MINNFFTWNSRIIGEPIKLLKFIQFTSKSKKVKTNWTKQSKVPEYEYLLLICKHSILWIITKYLHEEYISCKNIIESSFGDLISNYILVCSDWCCSYIVNNKYHTGDNNKKYYHLQDLAIFDWELYQCIWLSTKNVYY